MTSDYVWNDVSQVRCAVSVTSVIAMFSTEPRQVVDMPLTEWQYRSAGGKQWVEHISGSRCGISHALPNEAESLFPVIVGEGNGRKFLIDGAHRLAKAKLNNQPAIKAVILTEKETRQCVRNGQMQRFDQETTA